MLKVLHVASGNRWTGAAAPAFAEVAALREAGVDAHYAYVGGYKLEAKLKGTDFAHPIIQKAQNPVSFLRTAGALERLIDHHAFDILHAHLTYDHFLSRYVRRNRPMQLARTFHARRAIRSDPFTRLLIGSSDLICVTNTTLANASPIRDKKPLFTPPPLDARQFTPDGGDVRAQYGIPDGIPLVMVIGKVSKGRGFELAIETFAQLRRRISDIRFMIVGHGEHRPALEQLASETQVADRLTWAGYHEEDLASHYRAADVLLFTASGSDEGHRAITEAMSCGTVPVVAPLEGAEALVDRRLIAAEATPDALAMAVANVLAAADYPAIRSGVVEASAAFAYPAAAARLIAAYRGLL